MVEKPAVARFISTSDIFPEKLIDMVYSVLREGGCPYITKGSIQFFQRQNFAEKIETESDLPSGTPHTAHKQSHTNQMAKKLIKTISNLDMDSLTALRIQLDTLIAGGSADTTLELKSKEKAPKEGKKPRANAGQSTAWASFTSKVLKEHADEVAVVKATAVEARKKAKEWGDSEPEDAKAPHLKWLSKYKSEHEEEWVTFKAQWTLEHPKVSSDSSVTDEPSEGADGEKKKGRKKDSEIYTPEELVKVKAQRAAKRAAKKAEKQVVASTSEPVAPSHSQEAQPESQEASVTDSTDAEVANAELEKNLVKVMIEKQKQEDEQAKRVALLAQSAIIDELQKKVVAVQPPKPKKKSN